MLKPLGLIALTLFPAAFATNGLLAGDVGTSKSFHGPVGLVSPYSLRDLQKSQGLAAGSTRRVASASATSSSVPTAAA